MRSLTWTDVSARRVARHHLAERLPRERLVDAVRDTCGVQAQLMTAAELAIAARVGGITRTDVRAELLEQRELVKTYGLRGTIHVFAADELPLWMAAIEAVGWWREERWLRDQGATLDEMRAVTEAARDALDGRALTRRELEREIVRRLGAWATRKAPHPPFGKADTGIWAVIVDHLGGRICFGPNRGNEVTFVRAEQWLGRWEEFEPHDALAAAFRRYLRAYGPARPDDFAHWFRMERRDARTLAASLGDQLMAVDVEGHRAWLDASDARVPSAGHDDVSVRLLPDYDCYLIGCATPGVQRDHLVPAVSGRRVFGGGAGPFAALLVDGVVAGVWKRRRRGRRIEVAVEPFARLRSAIADRVEAEAVAVGRFLEAEVDLRVGSPA